MVQPKFLLRVALIGCPNAGKSTILNKIIGSEISVVSSKVHTTRKNVLGVYTNKQSQLEFYDAPGLVTRKHLLRHRLEDTFLRDPEQAVHRCDLVAVVVDASNIRERWRLNRTTLQLLEDHLDKKSILILNKVDLVNEKRFLIDLGIRLSQGFIDGKRSIAEKTLKRLTKEDILRLNLTAHLDPNLLSKYIEKSKPKPQHKYVIDLETDRVDRELEATKNQFNPDRIGFRNFSQIFSISALKEDGLEELKDYLISIALPVEEWPHGPDYVTNQNTREIVHGIIRGRVLDHTEHEVPYLVRYKYSSCDYDEMGSLHVHLTINCPNRYMIARVLGKGGTSISRIVSESRDLICKTLACDVKLDIQVEAKSK